ncbi:MAG: CBS domain-containing protein [Alphaproteobacteria bacterium]|nr:CBS domain-containing protein [Alphaproteobacteria bacterium]
MSKAKDIMRHQTFTLSPEDTVFQAAEKMKDKDVGIIVVGKEHEVMGILTDRDIVVRCVAKGKDPHETKVVDIMSSAVVHCMEDDSMENIAKKMIDEHIHRLPVLDQHMKLCGLVSVRNLCAKNHEKGGDVVSKIR